jgi:hypothetical protein
VVPLLTDTNIIDITDIYIYLIPVNELLTGKQQNYGEDVVVILLTHL